MKLLHGGLSPFVRKVMIIAHEKKLCEKLELIPSPVNPLVPLQSVIDVNPLGKIPALVTDEGMVLYGSTPVAEYLDLMDGQPRFFPSTQDRWPALRRKELADGILDAGNLVRIENLRPEEKVWSDWKDVQLLKVNNALDAFEKDVDNLSVDQPLIGEIALVCALGWLDVRLHEVEWRKGRAKLEAWFERISQRPSVLATAPKVPK